MNPSKNTTLIVLVGIMVLFLAGIWYMRGSTPVPSTETEDPSTQEAVYDNTSTDEIVIDSPKAGETVGTTFTVVGKARGYWYFEASFPLRVFGSSGVLLSEMPVQADGEWMTEEFVPFSETVTVPPGTKGEALLILYNDNPSGLPENDATVSIPLVIK